MFGWDVVRVDWHCVTGMLWVPKSPGQAVLALTVWRKSKWLLNWFLNSVVAIKWLMSVCCWGHFYRPGRNHHSPRMELFGLGADPEFCGYEVQGEEEMTSAGCRHQRDFSPIFHTVERSCSWSALCFHGSKWVKTAKERGKLPTTDSYRLWRTVTCFNPDLKGQQEKSLILHHEKNN